MVKENRMNGCETEIHSTKENNKDNGMKQTEIGLIPEDWEVKTIQEGFEICNNLRLPISGDIRKTMRGEYPYYGPTKIQDYINEFRVEGEYSLIGEDGDHFLKWEEIPMTQLASGQFNVNNHAHLIKGRANISLTKWFYHYFKHRDITSHLTRQGANRYKLSKSTLVKIPLAIPAKIEEQQIISTALSDCDAWIDSIEQVLTKKRLIKQGAMQELLTPKEDWKFSELGELTNIYTGKKNNQDKIENGLFPFFVRSQKVERINSYSFNGEAILVPGEGNLGSIFHYINGKFDFHQRVYKVSDFKGIQGKFTYWYFQMYFGQHAMQNTVKATVDSIRLPTLLEFEISFPSFSEQTRIATILSDMDLEIEALEQKLNKARQIKQGMMQELLTGRVRLV